MNRQTLRAVLVLACAALGAGLLAGCGDADDDPRRAAAATAVKQTVAATSKLDSARLTASFQLDPEGLLALGGPIKLRASGPFAAGAKGELPRLELDIGGVLARKSLDARAISTGKQAFLRIDGRAYRIDQDFVDKLRSHGTGAGATTKRPGLASLGLDPSAWLQNARAKGTAAIGGVQTQRIAGTIDVKRLLDDVAKLFGGSSEVLHAEAPRADRERGEVHEGRRLDGLRRQDPAPARRGRRLRVSDRHVADQRPRRRPGDAAPAPRRRQRHDGQAGGAEERAAALGPHRRGRPGRAPLRPRRGRAERDRRRRRRRRVPCSA